MTGKRAALLKEYVANGGILIIGCRSGYKQENGKCVMLPQPGLLQKITGSDVRDFTFTSPAEPSVTANWDGQTIDMPIFNDIMEPVEEGETLAFYDNSYYAGKPAVIRKNTGCLLYTSCSRDRRRRQSRCRGYLQQWFLCSTVSGR